MNEYQKLIADYMFSHGLDQIEMAKKLTIANSTLSRWLKHGTGMTRKNQAYIKHICMELTHTPDSMPLTNSEPLRDALLAKWANMTDTQKCKTLLAIEGIIKGGGDAIQSGELEQTEKMGFKSQLKLKIG
jgi:hypothetical protein